MAAGSKSYDTKYHYRAKHLNRRPLTSLPTDAGLHPVCQSVSAWSLGVTNAAAVRWEEAGVLLKSEAKPQISTDVVEFGQLTRVKRTPRRRVAKQGL